MSFARKGEASQTASPARSTLAAQIRAMVARKTDGQGQRQPNVALEGALPLNHIWEFWHDRQDRQQAPSHGQATAGAERGSGPAYEARLVKIQDDICDIRTFWQIFNNFENYLHTLKQRDSVHLFHRGVKPVWEDPRNVKGGSWTFRVPKEKSADFWKELATLAVGDQLQQAIATNRQSFNDDICGISYSVRYTSILITVWNRDGTNTQGIAKVLRTILESITPDLRLNQTQYYYKKHSEHAGFTGRTH